MKITGITGYVGFKTLITALEKGYCVRGVVRNEHNISELQEKSSLITKCHEQGRLEFVIVPDFLQEGALAGVLDTITAIVHLASPLAVEVSSTILLQNPGEVLIYEIFTRLRATITIRQS